MYTNRIDTAGNPIYEEVYRNEFIYVEAPEFVEPIEYFKHLEKPTTTCARTGTIISETFLTPLKSEIWGVKRAN